MRKLISLYFVCLITSCSLIGEEPRDVYCKTRPEGIPEWVEWNCEKQKAYEGGYTSFDADSTIFIWESGDSLNLTENEKEIIRRRFKEQGFVIKNK